MHRTIPFGALCAGPRVPDSCAAADSRLVKSAAARLRRQVSYWVGDRPDVSDHLKWLERNGFEREDSRQIRYTVEVFYNCEPIFAIAYALGARATAPSGGTSDSTSCYRPEAVDAGLIPLPQEHGRPGNTHAFFRALCAWPGYGEMMSHELAAWQPLPELVKSTACEAAQLACSIDVQGQTPARLRTPTERLLTACEVVVITSALRQMFINSETRAREVAALA